MITEYELYSDERYHGDRYLLLGGIICTERGAERLRAECNAVRVKFQLKREMRWGKISKSFLQSYIAWADVFFKDPYARFVVLEVDKASPAWANFNPRKTRTYPRTSLRSNIVQPKCKKPWNSLVDFSHRIHRRR